MERPPPTQSDLGLMGWYVRPELGRMGILGVFLLSATGLQLTAPIIIRRFVDLAAAGGARAPVAELWTLAGLYIFIAIAAQVLQIGSTYSAEQVAWGATNRLRRDLAAHGLALDMAYHTAHPPGEMIERVDGDVAALAAFFSQFVLQILGGGVMLAGILAILFWSDVRIGAALAAFVVIAAASLHAIRSLARRQWERLRQAWSQLSGFFEERLAGLDDIRANAGGGHAMARLWTLLRELAEANVAASRRGLWIFLLASFVFSLGFATALAVGTWLYLRREVSIGTVFMFVQYAGMMAGPIMVIGQQLQQMQTAQASVTRIRAILAEAPTLLDGPGADWSARRSAAPTLRFEHVDFAYRAGVPVIRDLTLELPAGEVLGLLGRTGSGKTTLGRLLFRLYEVGGGRITLDGRDIREATLAELRGRIGLVTQDVQLFDASVRDNVTLFDPAIPERRIAGALEELGLGDWLARQPEGLNTVLRGASGLSAGEAQLLALARVWLKDPGLIVLDEASSRLDPATDRLVEQALDRILGARDGRGPRTAVIIAHKLATVRRVDRIAILDAGRLVESGARARLEADENSMFARLLQTGLEETLA
jgi:ATP-binding cassette, subfamily B, bacterial